MNGRLVYGSHCKQGILREGKDYCRRLELSVSQILSHCFHITETPGHGRTPLNQWCEGAPIHSLTPSLSFLPVVANSQKVGTWVL